jgi:hypothetical protein
VRARTWVGQRPTHETTITLSFYSQKFATTQLHYPVYKLEFLAIVYAMEIFWPFSYNTTFTKVTDNKSVNYFIKQTTIGKRLTIRKIFLQSYDFTIIHTIKKNNILVDMLLKICEKRTANTEEEIMEDPTINKSSSALTFLLLSPSPN